MVIASLVRPKPQAVKAHRSRVSVTALVQRAETLFEQGYRIKGDIVGGIDGGAVLALVNPEGVTYAIDLREFSCPCVAFRNRMFTDAFDRATCKHLIGLPQLCIDQAESLEADVAALFAHLPLDRYERREMQRMAGFPARFAGTWLEGVCREINALQRRINGLWVWSRDAQDDLDNRQGGR